MSTQRVCYLHIGTHKTGSTSIQNFLRSSRAQLQERGIHVPLILSDEGNQTHKHFAFAVCRTKRSKKHTHLMEMFGASLKAVDADIIVSAETLAEKTCVPLKLEMIKRYFKEMGYRLHVIAYVREQASYINARYVQEIKRFRSGGSFPEFLADAISNKSSRYDYERHFAALMNDGEIEFCPRSFTSATSTGLIKDFISAIPPLEGLDILPAARETEIFNPNAGAKSVFVARLVSNGVEIPNARPVLMKLAPALKRHYMARKWYDSPFVGIERDAAGRIEEHFAKSNDKFSWRFWGCDWEKLHPKKTLERNVFSFVDSSPDEQAEVMEVVAALLNRVGRSRKAAWNHPLHPRTTQTRFGFNHSALRLLKSIRSSLQS